MAGKLDRLKARRKELDAQIQRETAREQQRARKERDARMMAWGVALDAALESGEISQEQIVRLLDEHLTRRTDRQRAFTGLLEGLEPATDSGSESTDEDSSEQ